MNCLIYDISTTVISGIVLTFILFLFKEYLLPKKNITGEWETKIKIKESSYNPFIDLGIEFKIHLLHSGNELIGSGEKVKDINPNGSETVFERKKRVKIEITGYYEKKYLRRSKVYFNVIENGTERESRSTYILTVKNKKHLKGTFTSTAGDSVGTVEMIRL